MMLREFFLGFVKIHILFHASQGPIYGLEMIGELARHGYDISPGTLYPILHSLAQGGYVRGHKAVVGGKMRKYYQITPHGLEALQEARRKIEELVGEVVEGMPRS